MVEGFCLDLSAFLHQHAALQAIQTVENWKPHFPQYALHFDRNQNLLTMAKIYANTFDLLSAFIPAASDHIFWCGFSLPEKVPLGPNNCKNQGEILKLLHSRLISTYRKVWWRQFSIIRFCFYSNRTDKRTMVPNQVGTPINTPLVHLNKWLFIDHFTPTQPSHRFAPSVRGTDVMDEYWLWLTAPSLLPFEWY